MVNVIEQNHMSFTYLGSSVKLIVLWILIIIKQQKSSLNRLAKLKDLDCKRKNEMNSLNVVKIHNSIGKR